MDSQAENSEPEWQEEEKAPSLADLPLSYDHSSPEFLHLQKKRPWKHVLKACRAPRTLDGHDFEFSSVNSTPKLQNDRLRYEFCPADKLFYNGQLLPLSSHLCEEYSSDSSLPTRQDSQSSNSSRGSTSQSSNGGSTSAATVIPNVSNQRRSSLQYLSRELLSSPETPDSSTASLRSQYTSSSSAKPRVSFSQDCRNPNTNPKTEKEFPSVKEREESRKGLLTTIISYGITCRNSCGVVAGAHCSKPKERNSQIGRFNVLKG